MIKRLSRLAAGAFVVALGASTLIAGGGAGAAPRLSTTVHPEYNAFRTNSGLAGVHPDLAIPTWKYKFTYSGTHYKNIVFVGTKPSLGAVSTKIPVEVIPVKMICGGQTNDPTVLGSGGGSAVSQTLASPLLQKSVTYTEGAATVKTQYEDAFQKVALWNKGASATGYHVLFKTPVVEPELTYNASADCTTFTYNGVTIVEAFQSLFDSVIAGTYNSVPGNVLPIFVTVNSFLADNSGNCCIGGYHSYNGVTTYADYNYLTTSGGFTQDVSALSHELGEWMEDPFISNSSQNSPPQDPATCATNDANNPNPLWEVGDPLEGNANFGDYAYTAGGFTWHLQDLVTPAYFGAPTSTSANGAETFQGGLYSVCQNGG
jgi:hypothetical protein